MIPGWAGNRGLLSCRAGTTPMRAPDRDWGHALPSMALRPVALVLLELVQGLLPFPGLVLGLVEGHVRDRPVPLLPLGLGRLGLTLLLPGIPAVCHDAFSFRWAIGSSPHGSGHREGAPGRPLHPL